MENEDFVLSITNLSSHDNFTHNTASTFKQKLASPLDFSTEQWEVALSSISFTRPMYHTEESKISISIKGWIKTQQTTQLWPTTYIIQIKIPPLKYSTLDNFLNAIKGYVDLELKSNFQKKRNEGWLFHLPIDEATYTHYSQTVEYNELFLGKRGWVRQFSYKVSPLWHYKIITEKVQLTSRKYALATYGEIDSLTVWRGLSMWHILGFTQFQIGKSYSLPILAEQYPTMTDEYDLSLMCVKAPGLVVEQRVGDKLIPVLDFVPTSSSNLNLYQTFSFTHPFYKKILRGYINDILIRITDRKDKEILFPIEYIKLILKFRKCQSKKIFGKE